MLLAAQPAVWHHDLAWAALALGFASALAILADEFALGNRQHMRVMDLVHPITALYLGPVWLWAYVTRGRKASHAYAHAEAQRLLRACDDPRAKADELRRRADSTAPEDLRPWHVADAVSHCGAGCTLGDVCGEWLVLTLGLTWFGTWSGHQLPEELVLDFVCAWTLGVAFQYFSGASSVRDAIRVDTASIVAFQVGLFGWMAIFMLVIWPHHGIRIDSPDFWFEMQVGMILGYVTAWPVNRLLVSRGIKEKMDHRRHLGMMLAEMAEERERPRGPLPAAVSGR